MLYSVILGNQSLLSDPFEIVEDGGNRFLAKKDINQFIRIMKGVSIDELPLFYKTANTTAWDLPEDLRWVNHPKTFNPRLQNKHAKEKSGVQHYIFLTIMSQNYRVVNYEANVKVLQTYHGKAYQGCVLVVDPSYTDGDILMSIDALDVKGGELKNLTLKMKDNKVEVNKKSVEKTKREDTGKKATKTKDMRALGFMIHTNPGQLLTDLYIVSEKYKSSLEKLLKSKHAIKNAILVCVDDGSTDEDIQKALEPIVKENKIRSCTEVGITMNLDIIKDLRILYVFDLDIKKAQLSCRKSH